MDWYSRLIALLKVLLPLMALGLLSTLFLLSRNVDPLTTIPFADAEIQDRMRSQQITAPFFSGASEAGDRLLFSAANLSTADTDLNAATDIFAQIDLVGGTRVVLTSDAGQFDLAAAIADLSGAVRILTSTGYEITSDALRANLDSITLTSPGPVTGTAPFGSLTAGQMALSSTQGAEAAQLIFTNGVKLIYDPKQTSETNDE